MKAQFMTATDRYKIIRLLDEEVDIDKISNLTWVNRDTIQKFAVRRAEKAAEAIEEDED